MMENLEKKQDQIMETDQLGKIDAKDVKFNMEQYEDVADAWWPLGNSRWTKILNILVPGAWYAVDKFKEYRESDEPATEHMEELMEMCKDILPKLKELKELNIRGPRITSGNDRVGFYTIRFADGKCSLYVDSRKWICKIDSNLAAKDFDALTIGQFRDIMKIINEEVDDVKNTALASRNERINNIRNK